MTLKNARKLRKQQTDAERCLWQSLRGRRFINYKFRRQHIIGNYIVDFVCLHSRLVIELDGSQHFAQQVYDNKRTEYLESQGFKVLRFWDNDIFQNTEAVLSAIYAALVNFPHPNPLPR